MTQLESLSRREQARLLRIYRQEARAIKTKLANALLKGNDTTYIRRVQSEISQNIKSLEAQFTEYAQKRLPLIYEEQGIRTDKDINVFEAKFDIDNSFGRVDKRAMQAIAENTQRSLKGITLQMGRQSMGYLRRIGLITARGIVVGSDTWQQASKKMTAELNAKNFFHVKYKLKNGKFREVPSDVYSRMVARTTSAEAFRLGALERIKARGYDLVDVVGRSGFPSSPCIPYQGKTLSITGKSAGYIALEEARAQGFNHPNCIHSLVFSEKNSEEVE